MLIVFQLAALEAELEAKHRENLKKTLKDAESRWEEKLEEVIIERNKFRDESSLLTQKVCEDPTEEKGVV